jgi:hypothetical protein
MSSSCKILPTTGCISMVRIDIQTGNICLCTARKVQYATADASEPHQQKPIETHWGSLYESGRSATVLDSESSGFYVTRRVIVGCYTLGTEYVHWLHHLQ